ncbi:MULTISPECIES: phage head morphogenesis protein [unclassified Marinovum]|uniref:phage head morphogenesis protein n=1 Tax=unclassified Marinovum TaxID=2647166 RepID=UPI003EDBAB2C
MADPLAAVFRRPFPEQVAAFRLRLGNLVPTARWDDIWQEAHDRAFMVAGATKADLLADLAGAVDKAISEGRSLEEFRRDFRATVEKHGWHGWTGEDTEAGQAWRTRVIYRTNARTTYAAGRYAQLTEGGFAYWIYRHGGSLEPREQHLGWDGLILEAGHLFWQTHYPPNGWGCSCYVTGARSIEGARRRGGDPAVELGDGWQRPDAKTGAPEGIDRGWAYAPGRSVAEDVTRMVAEKRAKLPQALGTALAIAASPGRAVTFEELLTEFETVLKSGSKADAEARIETLIARLPEAERPMARDMLREALEEKLQ